MVMLGLMGVFMKKYIVFLFAFCAAFSYAAENKIKGPLHLTYSYHALVRLEERNISKQAAEDTVRRGYRIIDRYNNLAFVLHENHTTIRIVTALDRPHVITAMKWKTSF